MLPTHVTHPPLEQRVAQRLPARFRSQGFIHHDLSRACLAQAADSIPRVILLGRLSLYGRRAERLHEELVPLAARWIEPLASSGARQRRSSLAALEIGANRDRRVLKADRVPYRSIARRFDPARS